MDNKDFLSLDNFNDLYNNINILIQNNNNFDLNSDPKYKKIFKKLVLSVFNKYSKTNELMQLNNIAINKCMPFLVDKINKGRPQNIVSYEYTPNITNNSFDNFNTTDYKPTENTDDYIKKIQEMEKERENIIFQEQKKINKSIEEPINNDISDSLNNFFSPNDNEKKNKKIFIIDTGTSENINVKLLNDKMTSFIVDLEENLGISNNIYIQMLSIHNILNIEELPNFYMYINELNILSKSNNSKFDKMILFSNTSTNNIFSLNCNKYIGSTKQDIKTLTITFSKNLFKTNDKRSRIIIELLIE